MSGLSVFKVMFGNFRLPPAFSNNRLNVNSGVSICLGRGFASMFGFGSGHDGVRTSGRVIQRRAFMGSHVGSGNKEKV